MFHCLKSRTLLHWITRLTLQCNKLSVAQQTCTSAGGRYCFSTLESLQPPRCHRLIHRPLSTLHSLTDGEQKIRDAVLKGFPNATSVTVEDISGGCGAMYDVAIESADFNGKKLVQQHRMVNKALKSEIADMHGIRITTKPVTS